MTRLQQLILERQKLADAQKAVFAEYQDVAAIPAEKLKEIEARNAEIKTADSEIERLTKIEEMKAAAEGTIPANKIEHPGSPNGAPQAKTESGPAVEFSRVASLKSFQGERGGRKPEERAYRFAKWFTGAVVGIEKHAKWCRENGIQIKAMVEGNNALGGYLVPHEFANDIVDLREQYGVARRLAKITRMTSDSKSMRRRRSGLTAYWVGEAQPITASDKTWDAINLVAKKLAALSVYSSELDEDSFVDIGDDLAGEIAYAFANKEDDAYFNGDGTSGYGGITGVREKLKGVSGTIANIKGLKVGTGNAYSELVLADFHGVIAKLPLYARLGAKWVVSSTFFDSVMHPLQTAAGGNTVANIASGGVQRFLGYDVELSQVMPTTEANSQVCALLGNFMLGSTLGDRRMITIAISSEYKFAEDELAIKGTERLDINIHDVGDTSVAGPIVGLITAAA